MGIVHELFSSHNWGVASSGRHGVAVGTRSSLIIPMGVGLDEDGMTVHLLSNLMFPDVLHGLASG